MTHGPIALEAYLDGFRSGFSRAFAGDDVETLTPRDLPGSLPKHIVHVIEGASDSATPFVLVTNGIGRVHQPRSTEHDDNEHVEFLAYVERHGPNIADLLSIVGRLAHMHDPTDDAFKAYDTVAFPQPVHGMQFFVFRPGGHVSVRNGPQVTLLAVVPLTIDQYRQVVDGNAEEWLEAAMAASDTHAAFLRGWAGAL